MKQIFWVFVIVPSLCLAHQDFASLTNFRATSPLCQDKFAIQKNDDGTTTVTFDSVKVERGDPKPFARCRLIADLFIPSHRQLSNDSTVNAKVRGHFEQIGDQVAARLLISTLDQRSSALISQRQTDAITSGIAEEHDLVIRGMLPQILPSQIDRTITLSIQLEGMINYLLDHDSKVSAHLDSLRFPLLPLQDLPLLPPDGAPS